MNRLLTFALSRPFAATWYYIQCKHLMWDSGKREDMEKTSAHTHYLHMPALRL